MVKARHWTRPHEFKAEVTEKDFVLVEEDISEDLKDGGECAQSSSLLPRQCFHFSM